VGVEHSLWSYPTAHCAKGADWLFFCLLFFSRKEKKVFSAEKKSKGGVDIMRYSVENNSIVKSG
jgi:hypothetical protein